MEEKQNVKLYQKWWFWVCIVSIVFIIGGIIYYSNITTKASKKIPYISQYSGKIINILEAYKENKITQNKAEKDLEILQTEIEKKHDESKDINIQVYYTGLSVNINSILTDFTLDYMTDSKIDEHIQKIKKAVK